MKQIIGALFLLLAISPPAISAISAPEITPSVQEELLAAHNKYRAEVGVPFLVWNPVLELSAKTWAEHLAGTGTLKHSQPGENLWMGTKGGWTPTQMVDTWGNEKRYYVDGIFPHVSTSGKWQDVGHYTQIISGRTTQLGCAIADNGKYQYLVCHYSPAGNVMNQPVKNNKKKPLKLYTQGER